MKTTTDCLLHRISLDLAVAFREYYDRGEDQVAEQLLTAYRNVRRQISKEASGKRHGSREAYDMMQGNS
jgi:hypothetical protein